MEDACRIKHPERGDMLTVRELARIQGFDDDFIFLGPIERQYEEVIQAFPPSIAKKVASVVLDLIREFRCTGLEDGEDGQRPTKRIKTETSRD
ncbi:hypothetical protein BO78DRAFT_417255 [Aspergillus sclerotiicarbonarius CBS 121057]|uniref:DNA (cytosine-5-)-methyltransferase n=1 Tax=Aspergillus sclerotiicarbonarius (strain CBS 121057 / IBT 28362) TaxID=1448318 RepID=A0A319ECK6_ASPSB|nr:hypothetical protein BO78DRAFT_417255 [Aspergillus sclerotiicarbonarius CBS 121057]